MNKTSRSLESGFDAKKTNGSSINRYSNFDSPAAYSGLRYGDSRSSVSAMAGNEKENDNDNSVDYLLSMLSHSPSASKETTPVKQTPVKAVHVMHHSEASLKVRSLPLLKICGTSNVSMSLQFANMSSHFSTDKLNNLL